MDDLDPTRPCTVIEETTGSSGSKDSAIDAGSSKQTSSLHLSIGLRSIGPVKQSPTAAPSNLPDSLSGESTSQKAGERPSAVQAESSPSIESPKASSQQVQYQWADIPLPSPAGAPHPSTTPYTYSGIPSFYTNFESGTYTSVSLHFGKRKVPALQSLQKKECESNPSS